MDNKSELREKIASALANARGGRRGVPIISNVLDLLPSNLKEEVFEDSDAILQILEMEVERSRVEGHKAGHSCQSIIEIDEEGVPHGCVGVIDLLQKK